MLLPELPDIVFVDVSKECANEFIKDDSEFADGPLACLVR